MIKLDANVLDDQKEDKEGCTRDPISEPNHADCCTVNQEIPSQIVLSVRWQIATDTVKTVTKIRQRLKAKIGMLNNQNGQKTSLQLMVI